MRYVEARVDENNRDDAYRIYVCRSLQLIPQNKYISKDFKDILIPEEKDVRTADEIITDVMFKAGLNFGEIQ